MPKFASRNVVIGAFVFVAVVIVASASGSAFLTLLYLLYVGAVLAALYLVVRWAVAGGVVDASRKAPASGGQDARGILDARYAGGEISREEYERMRRDLETP